MKLDKFKWPSFIVAGYRNVALYHKNKIKILATDDRTYYGVTWDHNDIYIGYRIGEPGTVSVFNSSYELKGTLPGYWTFYHQLIFKDDMIYGAITANNSIMKFDMKSQTMELQNWSNTNVDLNHINSIWFDDDDFPWVCYHNNVTRDGIFLNSQLNKLDKNFTKILDTITLGKDTHNVFIDKNLAYTCDSSNECLYILNLKTNKEKKVKIGMWVRGLAVTDKYILLGGSIIGNSHNERTKGDGKIYLLDRKKHKVLDEKTIKDMGAVMEIRVVGERDYAHNNIPFPGVL